jgi:hypothetical protein
MHSEYVILIAFPGNNVCTNVPQCYSTHTLPVLFLKPLKSASAQPEKVFLRNSPCVKGFTTLFIHRDATERKISYNLSSTTQCLYSVFTFYYMFQPYFYLSSGTNVKQSLYRPIADLEGSRRLRLPDC